MPVHLTTTATAPTCWAYWAATSASTSRPLMATFATPPAPPAGVATSPIDPTWSQWGWSVALERSSAQDWTTLADAAARRLHAHRRGPRRRSRRPRTTRPGLPCAVTIGTGLSASTTTAFADGSGGRLRLTVPLGLDLPSAEVIGVPTQPGSTTTVRIAPLLTGPARRGWSGRRWPRSRR